MKIYRIPALAADFEHNFSQRIVKPTVAGVRMAETPIFKKTCRKIVEKSVGKFIANY